MPAFTLFCLAGILAAIGVDVIARTQLYHSKRFWLFQLITAILTIIFDLFAHNKVWSVNASSSLGVEVLGSPVELLAFGFILLYLNVIAFELIQQKGKLS